MPPVGSRGTAPGQGVRGVKPPEGETLLAFGNGMDTANLLCFLKFENLRNQILRFFGPKKFNRPQFVTVCCKLMKSNESNMQK